MNPVLNNMRLNGAGLDAKRVQPQGGAGQAVHFRDLLDVQFSKHASLRLNDRNIQLTNDQMDRVADGIYRADEKGIRDSLVLVDDVALLINIKSRTVITAMSQATDNVFSNIDGAVIV